jgi:hypothetical protein
MFGYRCHFKDQTEEQRSSTPYQGQMDAEHPLNVQTKNLFLLDWPIQPPTRILNTWAMFCNRVELF